MKENLQKLYEFKNPFTEQMERITLADHIALKSLWETYKKGNFKHLGIVLERAEGKVKEKLEANFSMGLATALRKASDDSDNDDDETGILDHDESDD